MVQFMFRPVDSNFFLENIAQLCHPIRNLEILKKKSKKSGEFIIALFLKILAHYDTYIQKNHFRHHYIF